jgi:hypothetical protein
MNLVAKEFVAAQDPESPGVLVLSSLAGAAQELSGGVLLVNPYDKIAVAQALNQALAMPLDERRTRHTRMLEALQTTLSSDGTGPLSLHLRVHPIIRAGRLVEPRARAKEAREAIRDNKATISTFSRIDSWDVRSYLTTAISDTCRRELTTGQRSGRLPCGY